MYCRRLTSPYKTWAQGFSLGPKKYSMNSSSNNNNNKKEVKRWIGLG